MKFSRMPCASSALAIALAASMPTALALPTPTPAADKAMTVSAADRAAADSYWEKLGVTPPKGGFVTSHPWSPPWSGRSLIVPATWFEQAFRKGRQHAKSKTPMMIDAAALRADLPILHMVLQKNYSGWEVAARHGWDWNEWFKKWNDMLAAHGNQSIPDSQAFAPWFTYEKFQLDSHSGPEIPARFGKIVTSQSAMLATTPHAACTKLETADGTQHSLNPDDAATQPHAVERWNGRALQSASYVVYPSSFGEAKTILCGGRQIAATSFASGYVSLGRPGAALDQSLAVLGGHQKGLAIYNVPAPGIGYLRLAAFNDAGNQALIKLLPKLPSSAGHEKLLVVDLRGNDGGGAPLDLLSRWLPVNHVEQQFTQVSKRSCLYPGLWFNLGQVLSLGLKHPSRSDVREMQAAYAHGIDAPATTSCPTTFESRQGKWTYLQHHFVREWRGRRPRLLVLVDNQCGSDCEYMTWMLAQLPGTVIAGSNTFGVTGFTQPGFLLLPHTRIAFQLATSLSDNYGDGRSENGYGLDVDVALPTPADWSGESILALAERLADPTTAAAH